MVDQWALVKDAVEILEYRNYAPVDDQSVLATGKPRMLPVIEERPAYDPASEVLDGPDIIIGATQVTKRWTKRAKTQAEIDVMIASVDAAIEREFDRRWTAPIAHTVNGVEYMWHADRDAVINVMGVMLSAQAAGISSDATRAWTPFGSDVGVSVTIADVIALGIAIAQRKDALFATKKLRQAALKIMSPSDLSVYDASAGW